MSETWKSQVQLDQQADFVDCTRPDSGSCCPETSCVEESAGISGADGIRFCNCSGKSSIPIDFGTKAELRDGSAKKPIQLTGIQSFIGKKFDRLMAVRNDGTIEAISPPRDGCAYKVVADQDGFRFVSDFTDNEFDPDLLYTGEPDFILGGKVTENSCGKQVMRIGVYDLSDILSKLDVTDC